MRIESTLIKTIINRKRVRKTDNVQGLFPFAQTTQDVAATQEAFSPEVVTHVTSVTPYHNDKSKNRKVKLAHAEETLDALNDLQLSFLGHGSIDTQLKHIRSLMESKPEGASAAALQELLQMIELRTAVELAKRNA